MAEQDKLQIVVEVLRKNPTMTNEEIVKLLGLKRAFSAISWKIKAKQILQQEKAR